MIPHLALVLAEGGGFNPLDLSGFSNFLWTLVIFLLALFPIWKIVMGPVTRALEERDERSASAIAQAEQAAAAAQKAQAEVEVKRGEALAEASKLMAEARERAEAREHEIVEAAKVEAAGMVESARRAIQAEQDKALSVIRNEVVDLSIHAASRVLERNVGGEDDRRMVGEIVARGQAARN